MDHNAHQLYDKSVGQKQEYMYTSTLVKWLRSVFK